MLLTSWIACKYLNAFYYFASKIGFRDRLIPARCSWSTYLISRNLNLGNI